MHWKVETLSNEQFDINMHRRDGYDDGAAGVVEWSARQRARELLNVKDGARIAAAYLHGWLMGRGQSA